jgi:3-isopropylmalate/(R)-2-methylmalate dehydratase small subunit
MKRPRSEGYGPFLLHDLRADLASEAARLDDPIFAGAQILVARRNFGSGSSREAAVYALADYGFRCILAPSFGDIFASNAVKNGVLPAIISEADAETLLNDSTLRSGGSVHIDLAQQTVRVGNHVMKFEIEPVWKTQLLNGWDDIDMTRSYSAAIADFVTRDAQARPWAKPSLG